MPHHACRYWNTYSLVDSAIQRMFEGYPCWSLLQVECLAPLTVHYPCFLFGLADMIWKFLLLPPDLQLANMTLQHDDLLSHWKCKPKQFFSVLSFIMYRNRKLSKTDVGTDNLVSYKNLTVLFSQKYGRILDYRSCQTSEVRG